MKTKFIGIHWNSLEFIGIILSLSILTSSYESLACELYNTHVNGPSLVCPNQTYEYWADHPPEFFCGGSFITEEWILQEGNAHFVDENGVDLGNYLVCSETVIGHHCLPGGIVRIRTNSAYGTFGLRVTGHCNTGIGTAEREYTIFIGVPPPNSLNGPSIVGCAGSTLQLTAPAVQNATTYTWVVPNSTWLINGTPGPSRTMTPTSWDGQPSATITVGSTAGDHRVGIRSNTNQCVGNGFTYKDLTLELPPAELQATGANILCQNQSDTYTVTPVAGAVSYSYYIENGSATINGGTYNSSSQLTTSANSITLATPALISGQEIWLKARANGASGCASSPFALKKIWEGIPEPVNSIALAGTNGNYSGGVWDLGTICIPPNVYYPTADFYAAGGNGYATQWEWAGFTFLYTNPGANSNTANLYGTGPQLISVRQYNVCGWSPWLEKSFGITYDECTGGGGTGEEGGGFGLRASPNPGDNEVEFSVDAKEDVLYSVENSQGEKVLSGKGSGKIKLALSQLPDGIYYLHVADKKCSTQRILVRHK